MTFFNATRDKLGMYVEQARDTAADLIVVLLKSGSQADGAMADHGTLAAILAGSGNVEADFTGYTRKTFATPTRTQDDALDRVLLGGAAVGTEVVFSWAAATRTVQNNLGRALIAYLPSAGAANTLILPLYAPAITVTTDNNELQVKLAADGFARVRTA